MTEELPDGWIQVSLGDLLEPGGLFDGPFGSHLKTSDYTDSGVRVVRLENVANLRFVREKETYISPSKYRELTKHTVGAGDIIVGSFVDGAVRACVLPPLPTKAIAKADCFTVRTNTSIAERRFVAYQLGTNAARDALVEEIHGATRPRITTRQLRDFSMRLAPIAEQRRIIEKVEALLGQVACAKDRLDRVPLILKRFRQAVLAAACSGELTQEWRAAHGEVAPATAAFDLQRRRHREAWNVWRSASPSRRASHYEGPKLVSIDGLPNLPDSWSWARFGFFGDDPLNAVQTGPFGALLHREEFVPHGVPVIAVGNLTGLGFTRDGLYFVTREKAAELDRFNVNAGDLLFARSGATLGKVCVAPSYVNDWRMTGHILRARLWSGALLSQYAAIALWGCPAVLEQVAESIRGVTRPGYNTSLLEEIHIPVPPVAEQEECIRRVNQLCAIADAAEQRLQAAFAQAERLPQAILSKAFTGELVPTEAELARAEERSFETADELLDRNRGERDTAGETSGVRPALQARPDRARERRVR